MVRWYQHCFCRSSCHCGDRYKYSLLNSISLIYVNAVCIILICVPFPLAATSDYRQSLQFQNLNEEKRNIHVEVRAWMIMQLIDDIIFVGLIFESASSTCLGYPRWEKS